MFYISLLSVWHGFVFSITTRWVHRFYNGVNYSAIFLWSFCFTRPSFLDWVKIQWFRAVMFCWLEKNTVQLDDLIYHFQTKHPPLFGNFCWKYLNIAPTFRLAISSDLNIASSLNRIKPNVVVIIGWTNQQKEMNWLGTWQNLTTFRTRNVYMDITEESLYVDLDQL